MISTAEKQGFTSYAKRDYIAQSLVGHLYSRPFITHRNYLAIISILKIEKPSQDFICLSQNIRRFNKLGEAGITKLPACICTTTFSGSKEKPPVYDKTASRRVSVFGDVHQIISPMSSRPFFLYFYGRFAPNPSSELGQVYRLCLPSVEYWKPRRHRLRRNRTRLSGKL